MLISENELEEYFLYRRDESHWALKTLRLCCYGIRFYYQCVLNTDWNLFSIPKAQKEERLPEIPTKEAIHNVLSRVTTFHNFTYFSTVYSCGLPQALNLRVSGIDSARMTVYVNRGKGTKDCSFNRVLPVTVREGFGGAR